jgi:hypothetical protein
MPLQYYKTVLSVTDLDTASLPQMDVDPSDSRLQSDQTRTGLLGLVSAYQKDGDGGHFGRMISAGMNESDQSALLVEAFIQRLCTNQQQTLNIPPLGHAIGGKTASGRCRCMRCGSRIK